MFVCKVSLQVIAKNFNMIIIFVLIIVFVALVFLLGLGGMCWLCRQVMLRSEPAHQGDGDQISGREEAARTHILQYRNKYSVDCQNTSIVVV